MYQALLFAPDGDWVTDFEGTKEEVEEELANKGSKWYFYPFECLIKKRETFSEDQRIVEAYDPVGFLTGKKIKTALKYFTEHPKEVEFLLSL